MPRLVVLLEQLLAPVPGGTARYSRELTRALVATAPPGWTVGAAVARHADPGAALVAGIDDLTVLPLPRRALVAAWESGVPWWPGGDTVHAPTPLAPPGPRRGRGLVVTVHDTVPWTHPQTLTRRGTHWHRRMICRAARRADALVVPTAAVAAELRRYLPHPTRMRLMGRMHVVGQGATPAVVTAPQPQHADGIAARLDLPPYYVLAIGTLEPRKGIDVLLDALASPHGPDVSLVLVGQRGWGGVHPEVAARRAGFAPSLLRVLGEITDAELAVVLHRAAVLAAPSQAEGFGLPVLEAMAAGVPVVHSDVPALVEVAGSAGVSVPRNDRAGLAAALRAVLADRGTAEAMVTAGRQRARQFSWEHTARQLWAVHVELHHARSRGDVRLG
ncbi:MAG: glycosyltransferase family 4 protein [Actinomycetota bacterium]|nr:glycosyltransferase family 4 protein [Actinomycetota bacterium]